MSYNILMWSAVPETEFGREPTHLGRMCPRDVSQQYKQQSICSASHSSSSRIDNTLCFINFHMQVNICVHTHMYTYTHRWSLLMCVQKGNFSHTHIYNTTDWARPSQWETQESESLLLGKWLHQYNVYTYMHTQNTHTHTHTRGEDLGYPPLPSKNFPKWINFSSNPATAVRYVTCTHTN